MDPRNPIRTLPLCAGLAFGALMLLLGGAGPAHAQVAKATKTILIVRHAEALEAKKSNDPPLAPDGERRATELARVVAEVRIQTIFATALLRSRQTAEAVAHTTGRSVTIIADVPLTVAALRKTAWGTTSLVVGHSNTIPALLAGLGAAPPTGPVGYDTIWVVTLGHEGSVTTTALHYGAP